jgi:predicted nucleic acid-binding protein
VNTVVDTSVWSLVLRKKGPADHATVDKLVDLLNGVYDVAITGSILQEVLQAFRSDRAVEEVTSMLRPITLLELDRETSIEAARLFRRCAAVGVTASTIDCQIAAIAVRHEYALLSADADFEQIARVCDLALI